MTLKDKHWLLQSYDWEVIVQNACGAVSICTKKIGETWVYGYWILINTDDYLLEPDNTNWHFAAELPARKAAKDTAIQKLSAIVATSTWEYDVDVAKGFIASIR